MTTPESNAILAEASDNQVQGKRCLAIGNYQAAVDFLEQACQQFDSIYGVGKRECADAYLDYGLALVALANAEANIITNVEGDDDDDEEDDEEVEKENDDLESDPNKQNDTQAPQPSDSRQQQANSSTNQKLSTHKEESSVGKQASDDDPVAGTSSGVSSNQNDDDTQEDEEKEATTMEVAWEVLCLAKRVFMTDESLDAQLKLAETLQKLGEISIEWDNNDNATSILEECLKIRKAILKGDDRLISSTYYNLGLAHSFKNNTAEANDCFTESMKTIQKRIDFLQAQLKLANETQDVVAKTAHEKELQELKELLPEISMRIDEEETKTGDQAIKRSREEVAEEEAQLKRVCADKSKPVDDISHLVKRK